MISEVQLKGERITVRFGPTDQKNRLQQLSEIAVWEIQLSDVRRQIVPDLRSSCT